MTLYTDNKDNNAIEQMMLEIVDARRAGVFGRTSVDIAALLSDIAEPRKVTWLSRHRHAMMGMSAAACLGIIVTLGTLQSPQNQTATIAIPVVNTSGSVASAPVVCYTADNLTGCLTGPGNAVSPECSCADIDNDGDVDLQDFRELQLASGTDYQQ